MKPLLIDTHSHINFKDYKDDGFEIIERSLDSKLWMINVGSQPTTSARAVKMAEKYKEGVYAAIGIHPIHLVEADVDDDEVRFKTKEEKFEASFYQKLVDEHIDKMGGVDKSKIVAVGEIGLEYYRLGTCVNKKLSCEDIKNIQKEAVMEQMKFSHKNNLPLIVHCRGSVEDKMDAYRDLYDLLVKNKNLLVEGRSGSIHCYGGNIEMAEKFIDLGFCIGFTGVVTFGKNADDVREVVRQLPLDKILVETDCPYLAPDPHRGERNEPLFVEYVARKIAEIKGLSFEEVAKKTTENARRLFGI